MVAENFGKTGSKVFITGVAYDDLNKNDSHMLRGEGRGGKPGRGDIAGGELVYRAVGYALHRLRKTTSAGATGAILGEALRWRSVCFGA